MVFGHKNDYCGCRWRRRKDARPEEILDAALVVFTEKGFAGTRLEEVARAAGISKGTLYLYFKSKQEIFEAAIQHTINPRLEQVEKLVDDDDGPAADLLVRLLREWWSNVTGSHISALPKLIISESGNFPELAEFFTRHVVRRTRHLFASVIQKGMDGGEFISGDATTLARLALAPMIQGVIWMHSLAPYDDPQDPEQYIDTHIRMFIQSISMRQE
jgi:AcrR family transcriptional regulator